MNWMRFIFVSSVLHMLTYVGVNDVLFIFSFVYSLLCYYFAFCFVVFFQWSVCVV